VPQHRFVFVAIALAIAQTRSGAEPSLPPFAPSPETPFLAGANSGGDAASGVPDPAPDPCAPAFQPGFDFPGGIRANPGVQITALTVFDPTGSGPQAFMAGGFYSLGGTPAEGVGRWTGDRFVGDTVADYLDFGTAPAMTTFDDGSGDKVYFSGQQVFFRPNNPKAPIRIRRWNPGSSAWEDFNTGPIDPNQGSIVLEGFNEPGHDFLYASSFGFDFEPFVARWDGTVWTELEDPAVTSDLNWDFELFDDGSGPAIYATNFAIDESDDRYVAKWTGSGWQPVGQALGIFGWRLAELDGQLYTAAFFGTLSSGFWKILRLEGDDWVELPTPGPLTNTFADLRTLDDGSGPALWALGRFERQGPSGVESTYMARWNGAGWDYVGGPGIDCRADPSETFAFTAREAPPDLGAGLLVSGRFRALNVQSCPDVGVQVGGVPAHGIAHWDGQRFHELGGGFASSITFDDRALGAATSLAAHDDGSGPALYAGGEVPLTGTIGGGVARLTPEGWEEVGVNPDTITTDLLSTSIAGDERLLAAVARTNPVGDPQVAEVLSWDGEAWSAIASGISGFVFALQADGDDIAPAGATLYAAGDFQSSFDGEPRAFIAQWDGVRWSGVGGGVNDTIAALAHDPQTDLLYAAGAFTSAGAVPALRVASWDGTAWSPLGAGLPGPINALAVFDDGSGPALYAGGIEPFPGDEVNQLVFKWDGSSWSSLPPSILSLGVSTMFVDAGSSPEPAGLWVGGSSRSVSNAPALARWDGAQWTEPGDRLTHFGFNCRACDVGAIQRLHGARGPALFLGGFFTTAFNADGSAVGASGLVRYQRRGLATSTGQPEHVVAAPGDTAVFSVEASAQTAPIEYQWLADGAPLADGPFIQGAASPQLHLLEVRSDQSGPINCIVTTPCGMTVSRTVSLTVIRPGDCPGDTSGDGVVDFRDVYEVLAHWPTDPGPIPGDRALVRGDANGDGLVSFSDITTVLMNWGRDCTSGL